VDSPQRKSTLEEEQGALASTRTNSRVCKAQALELAQSGQKSSSDMERALGITRGLLPTWKARMTRDGQPAFSGPGHVKEDEELRRQVRRDGEGLRQARDILKKALVIFSSTAKSSRL
jgi:transposase